MKQSEDTLRLLLLQGLDGNNDAYAAFLTQSSSRLRAYFRRRLLAWPDDVEDLVQETLIALHNQRATYRPAQPLTAWLHAIARYKLIDSLRARKVREAVIAPIATDDVSDADEAFSATDDAAGEAHRDLHKLLAGLPERHRLPIVCVKLEGLSVAETALRIGMSESAVKIGIHRGLKALAAKVRGNIRDDIS